MSVGHVARLVEAAGIATVIIAVDAFKGRLEAMTPPRVLFTPHLMGRPLGPPHDRQRQRATLLAALDLLEHASAGGSSIQMQGNTSQRVVEQSSLGRRRDAERA